MIRVFGTAGALRVEGPAKPFLSRRAAKLRMVRSAAKLQHEARTMVIFGMVSALETFMAIVTRW